MVFLKLSALDLSDFMQFAIQSYRVIMLKDICSGNSIILNDVIVRIGISNALFKESWMYPMIVKRSNARATPKNPWLTQLRLTVFSGYERSAHAASFC